MKKVVLPTLLVIAAIILSACSSSASVNLPASSAPLEAPAATAAPDTQPSTSVDFSSALAALEGTLTSIYEQVNPSVVNIQVTGQLGGQIQLPFDLPNGSQGQPPVQSALGSGFVWDQQGHIVTNNHVVDGADKIVVRFADGSQTEAKLVGQDADSDLAVIKVDVAKEKLVPVQVADSDSVKVGQLSIAIGNPFGLEGTQTVGFISALGRSLRVNNGIGESTYSIPDIIQTDAPINPGNSGGVLVNDQGQVIGVTAAIESPVEANAGIGFVIPSNIVKKIVPVLIENGQYEHPYLGIRGTSLTPDLAKAMNLPEDQRGALVIDVTAGGPADQGGLQGSAKTVSINGLDTQVGGDVITAIDGQPVLEMDDIISYLARSTEVGQKVELTVLRDGKETSLEITLGARPAAAETRQTAGSNQPENRNQAAYLGISGIELNDVLRKAMNLPEDTQGVLVLTVASGSAADKAGLKAGLESFTLDGQEIKIGGDIITVFDGSPITSMTGLREAVASRIPGDIVILTILRDGKEINLEVTLGTR